MHANVFRILFEQQFLKKADSPFLEGLEKPAERYVDLVQKIAGSLCEKEEYAKLVFDIAGGLCKKNAISAKERARLRMIIDGIKSAVDVARDAGHNFVSESLEKGGWNYESLAFLVFDVCRSLGMEPGIIDTSGGLFVASGSFVINPMGILRIMARKEFDERGLHVCYEGSDAVKMRYLHHLHIAYEMVKEDFWGAVREVDRAQNLNPNCVCAHLMRARFFRRKNDFQNALVCYNKALEIAPKDWTVILEKARFLERFGDLYGAKREYEGLVRMNPGKIDCCLALYHVELLIAEKEEKERQMEEKARRFNEELQYWSRLIEKNKLNPRGYVERARLWRWHGDAQRANWDYYCAFLLNPKDWKVWAEIGFFLRGLGDCAGAMAVFEKGYAATGEESLWIHMKFTEKEMERAVEER